MEKDDRKMIVYPVVIQKTDDKNVPYYVSIPDFDRGTQGMDLQDAEIMAEDLLRCLVEVYAEQGKELPEPSDIADVKHDDGDVVMLIQYKADN